MLNICIIDHHSDQNAPIEQLLRAGHHVVEAVSTCSEAFAVGANRCWHLIFISLNNLSIEGLEWIPRLRQAWPGALLIVVGDINRPDIERRVRSQGVDFYLLKTSDFSHLKMLVRHFEKKFAREQKRRSDNIESITARYE